MNSAEKLQKLRQIMDAQGLGGFIVPRTDEYQGEYVAAYAERLAWLTGFTGSAGMAIILTDKAVVMSDGRYTIQLNHQVDGTLYERENSQDVKPHEWLAQHASEDSVIGYDPKLHTPSQIEDYIKAGINLQPVKANLIDEIWKDQPVPPKGKVSLFNEKYAGVSAADKIQTIQQQLQEEKAEAAIITLSDSIAWLLNIRGSDIPHIPVALSKVIIPAKEKAQWFIDPDKMTNEVKFALEGNVAFYPEEQLPQVLQKIKGKVWLDTKRSSVWFKNQLGNVLEKDDPCILPRACKNSSEQQAMKQAHIRDAVALIKFLKWFEEEAPKEVLTELSVEKKLEGFRCEAPQYKEASFSTIAGYGANGAIVHYRATEATSQAIKMDNLLLLDSGAQYEDGTTDITRTICVGTPTTEMRENNTLVLKGHIALANAKFKKGTIGKELDQLARKALQAKGLDYAHGTGHGVGCYLSVHEEAANISPRGDKTLEPGMILSNEPGYYKEGAYGIRIENLILTKENDTGELYFETITLVPLDKNLIEPEMLDKSEKNWLNNYHQKVFETVSPLLDQDHADWLKVATSSI
ncbi:MAG: aminopeptidase P family protein [Alphaproteobacteria bacterium]|nr:aminopeptidase P family protein [Alphaproteobacteria bacterium]